MYDPYVEELSRSEQKKNARHELNLFPNLVLKVSFFLSSSFRYLSLFTLKSQLMYLLYWSVDQLINHVVPNFPKYWILHKKILSKEIVALNVKVLRKVVVTIVSWQERHRHVLDRVHSPLVAFCLTIRGLWLSLIVFSHMVCVNNTYILINNIYYTCKVIIIYVTSSQDRQNNFRT